MYEQKRKGKKIIVVMASRRRAMKELRRALLEDFLRGKDILHIKQVKRKI